MRLEREREMNFACYLNTIEPLSSTNYPIWNEKVQAVLKVLDLDYALHEDKPITPFPIYDNYVDMLREYMANSEKWEKSNRLAKNIIKHSISAGLRGAFPNMVNNKELTAKEFHNSIGMHFHKIFLVAELIYSRYDGQSGLSEHVKCMFNMAIELNELVCNFCKVLGHVISQCAKCDEWLRKNGT
ncbi:hypothetical protein BS78_09G103400 [Paspalum vaginatum]|nr:hypothetical protein BS78_09G103400 [Paspalum vaginatum]